METVHKPPLTPAQESRLWREEYLAYRLKGRVEGHARELEKLACRLWPRFNADVKRAMVEAITEWLHACPGHNGTRSRAAAHEASHYVALEVLGLSAFDAEIYGSRGDAAGWGGHARCLEKRLLDAGGLTIAILQKEGVLRFAGPAAECVLICGPFSAFRPELIETYLCAAKLAEMQGIAREEALGSLIRSTASLIDSYHDAICEVADILERRKRVVRYDRCVKLVLDSVRSGPLSDLCEPRPKAVEQLSALIGRGPVDLAALTSRIVP